jgi:hypothetical protein
MKDSTSLTTTVTSTINWKHVLLVLVVMNLIGGIVFIVTEGLVPSWVVYPILLIVGALRLRKGGTTGTVFLGVTAVIFILVHFPFTFFGPEGSACPQCSQVLLWVTLFVVPLLTTLVAVLAWRQARESHYETGNAG